MKIILIIGLFLILGLNPWFSRKFWRIYDFLTFQYVKPVNGKMPVSKGLKVILSFAVVSYVLMFFWMMKIIDMAQPQGYWYEMIGPTGKCPQQFIHELELTEVPSFQILSVYFLLTIILPIVLYSLWYYWKKYSAWRTQ